MPTTSPQSLTRTATRFALGVLSLVAVLPPLAWLAAGGLMEHSQAHAAARGVAWLLDRPVAQATEAPDRARLVAALGLPLEGSLVAWGATSSSARASDAGQLGHAPAAPTFTVHAPLARGGVGGAEVRVERSLRPLLLQALWVALASCGVAVAGWGLGIHRTMRRMARAETRMLAGASLDPLTGLLNRDGLGRRLQRALERQREGGAAVGVLLIDLDRFGLINTTLGQAAGDEMLRGVANRIRAVTRAGDGLARLGGDQFAVHVDTVTGVQALMAMARNLQRAFEAPYLLGGREVVASFSMGMAVAEQQGASVDDLLHRATQAVRSAKKQGGNRFGVYEAGGDQDDSPHRMDLEQRLRGALEASQFFVVYQPIVDAGTGRMGTVEALLRWQDPERGTISPVEFIPALEQTGMIVPVGRWVLREACLQAMRWPGVAVIDVSVNVSPMQFAEPDFTQMVAAVLRETGLPPRRLQLEVTEGLLLDPTPEALAKIDGLGDLGVRLAIDDFGMGYSSLVYLKRFRLHALKIDRMFVRDIAERPEDHTIVRAIIDLGHGLGMRVTAEGVETPAQRDALRELGCDSLQGYLFGRPALPGAFEASVAVPTPDREGAPSLPGASNARTKAAVETV